MPRYFVESSEISSNRCLIKGDDYHHLVKVRRVRTGDCIDVCSDNGKIHRAEIKEVNSSSVIAEFIESSDTDSDPINLILCLSLLKGKSFDTVIRKAVEIGVCRIVPMVTENTIPDVSKKERTRIERWEKIILEASKQSLRNRIPVIDGVTQFKKVASETSAGVKIIASTNENSMTMKQYISKLKMERDVAIMIGPEGGFSHDEISCAIKNGWTDLNFGYTCLKAETAAVVLPAILIYEWGVLNEADS